MPVSKQAANLKGKGNPSPKPGPSPTPRQIAPRTSNKPAPARPFAGRANPAPKLQAPGGTNPFGSDVGGGGGAVDFGAPANPVDDASWLSAGGDAAYQAQVAALNAALEQQLADLNSQQGKYDVDYGDSLKSLGWNPGMVDDPKTDINEAQPGRWNTGDLTTAAGRSDTNQKNDFASRGLLQSSAYGTARNDLFRQLDDQVAGLGKSRQSFLDDILRQQTSSKSQNDTAKKQAEADALMRRAAGVTL